MTKIIRTHESAKKYVYDISEENWEVIEETEHMRMSRLTYKDLTFYQVAVKVDAGYFDRDGNRAYGFRYSQYFDALNNEPNNTIGIDDIVNRIWKRAQKGKNA